MTRSTTSFISAAITSPPISTEPPGPRPFKPGPRSPAWPLRHSPHGAQPRLRASPRLRVSRVVQLVLNAEPDPAKGLGVLVDRVLESGMSRYQFIHALLELSSALEHWPGLADQEDEGYAGIWASGKHRAVRQL